MAKATCHCVPSPGKQSGKVYKGYGLNTMGCDPKTQETGDTLGPFVKVKFLGSDSCLTVGNDSSAPVYEGDLKISPGGAAVITSFEFGHSDGMTVKITVADQQGGHFQTFMTHLIKNWKDIDASVVANRMMFQFGWVKERCNGAPVVSNRSHCYVAWMDSIETNFSEGKFVAEITGKDFTFRTYEGSAQGPYEQMCLKEAIETLLTNPTGQNPENPIYEKVKFQRLIDKDTPIEIGFDQYKGRCCPTIDKETGKKTPSKGPLDNWQINGQDKISAIKRWMKPYNTDHNLGWREIDTPTESAEMIYWEQNIPKCDNQNTSFWKQRCVGTYVVNGGENSPVLEFNPKIRWDFSRLNNVGGNIADQVSNWRNNSKTEYTCDMTPEGAPGAGIGGNQQTSNESVRNQFGPDDGMEEAAKAITESQRVQAFLMHDQIEADLVVIGDPHIVNPITAMQCNCQIIFVNPFYIQPKPKVDKDGKKIKDGGCGQWLADPPINDVLSNMAWRISSVTHKIELGKYTTTLGLYLAVPGVEGNTGAKLGLWTGGWPQ